MKTTTKTKATEKINSQILKQVGFEKGDVRKACSKKQANINKGKGKKDRKKKKN